MPQLGLGLGLDKSSRLKSLAQLVKSAGGVLYLDARKADGIQRGINSPLTNPMIDLTKNSNNATLTNFAGTQTDGYTLEATVNSNGQAVGYDNIATTKADPLVTLTSDSSTFSTDSTTFGNAKRIYVKGEFTATTGTPTLNLRFQDSATALTTTLSATSKVVSFIGTTNSGATNKQIGFYCSPTLNATMYRQQLINITDNPLIQALETALGRQLTALECDRIFPFVATTGVTYVSARPYKATDGVDSYDVLANNPSVDITGTEDFAIACGFLMANGYGTTYLISKNTDAIANMQYGVYIENTGLIRVYLNGTLAEVVSVGTIQANVFYDLRIYRVGGRLKVKLNSNQTFDQPNVISLLSQPNLRLFCRSSNAGGTTHVAFTKALTAYLILARGTYGDLSKLDGVLDKVARDYR